MILSEVLHDLGEDEPLRALTPVGEGLYTARLARGRWLDAARWLSTVVGGMVFAKANGMTWVCGKQVETVLTVDGMDDLVRARALLVSLGLEPKKSMGGCCRSLLAYVGTPQYPEKGIYARYSPHLLGYHDCSPGEYPDCDYHDVAGCYFALMSRLPSLRVTYSRSRLVWHAWHPGEEDRWRSVLAGIEGIKPLRNTLWGCSIGGTSRVQAWHAGQITRLRGRLGPFRPAGLVVGRSAWELCCLASHAASSVLSNTDSVIARGGEWPAPWDRYGLVVRTKFAGDADVCHWGSYRIGPHETPLYTAGSRTRVQAPRQEITGAVLHSQWLTQAA